MDPPKKFKQEYEPPDSRVKLEKSNSPAPSCVSQRSMDPPDTNFKKEFTPKPIVKLKKSESPAPSCVSLRSMDPPDTNFKEECSPKPIAMKLERSHSGLHSMDSEDIKRESITPAHSSELAAGLLTKEDFRCAVCTGVLKDPVSIPCGHSYCRECITSYWLSNQAGHYACLQCPHTYTSRPALYSNLSLTQVVHKLEHFSPVLPAQSYAGPGDVECDFCSGRKLKAVKTCLTCTASYCDIHVKDHYKIPVLNRHTLVEAVESLEEKLIYTELKQEGLQSESKDSIQTAGTSHSKSSESRKSSPVMVTAMQQEILWMKRKESVLEDLMSTYGHNIRKEGKMSTREQIVADVEGQCSLCSQSLKEPVAIPCGHSYCRECITPYLEQSKQAGHYTCPQCLLPSKANEVHRQEQEMLQQNAQQLKMLMQQAVQEQQEEWKLLEPKQQRQMEREREAQLVWQWQAKRVQQAMRVRRMQQELQEAKQQQQQEWVQQIEQELEEEWMLIALARPFYLYTQDITLQELEKCSESTYLRQGMA